MIIAKKTGQVSDPAPEGAWAAVCVDVVDLGIVKVSYAGEDKKQHKIRIVWQIAQDNPRTKKPFEVSKRYTLSLHEKAGLRKDLEAWRGRAFTQEEVESGWDVEAVVGAQCLLSIAQVKKPNGDIFANVNAIMRLPKGVEGMRQREYVRVKDRKEDGAAEPDQYVPSDDDVPF